MFLIRAKESFVLILSKKTLLLQNILAKSLREILKLLKKGNRFIKLALIVIYTNFQSIIS